MQQLFHMLIYPLLLVAASAGVFSGALGRLAWQEATASIGSRGTAIVLFLLAAVFLAATVGIGVTALFLR